CIARTHPVAFYTRFTHSVGGLLLSLCPKSVPGMTLAAKHLNKDTKGMKKEPQQSPTAEAPRGFCSRDVLESSCRQHTQTSRDELCNVRMGAGSEPPQNSQSPSSESRVRMLQARNLNSQALSSGFCQFSLQAPVWIRANSHVEQNRQSLMWAAEMLSVRQNQESSGLGSCPGAFAVPPPKVSTDCCFLFSTVLSTGQNVV
ncbi:hypothetical protein Nmel_001941, partial [Mimus melanotis]